MSYEKDKEDSKPKILYIDDDPLNRSLVNRVLTSYDFIVLEAETGLKGIEIARREIPNLILMDINMPGLDGHETTTRMRSMSLLQDIPIIAVTARTTKGERELAIAAGCDGYIAKPIDVDKFPHQVISYLSGHKDTIPQDEQQRYMNQYSQKLVQRLEDKVLELEDANRQLQKVDKLKSDFVTLAAHELRTPLTLVYGYARLLHSTIEENYPEEISEGSVGDLAGRIYHSVHRLNEVVNDILNISLIEANEMHILQQSVNLAEVIDGVLQELHPAKNDRNLTITKKNIDSLAEVVGDKERLKQVFWNIISNAIKFTPNGGAILLEGRTVPLPSDSKAKEGEGIIILVKDTGVGIDPTELKDIFERFYIVGNTNYHSSSKTAYGGGGMGLGLTIAKGIIEAHGGRIWAESSGRDEEKNPGSEFYVLLPRTPPPSRLDNS